MVKFAEHIQLALNVSGYDHFLQFDDDIFLMDNWNEDEGLKFLVGMLLIEHDELSKTFVSLTTLELETYHRLNDEDIVLSFSYLWYRINKLWLSNSHPHSNPPAYYIEWALSKGLEIPWLKYAIEKGFYIPKSADIEKPLLNTERDTLLVIIAALAKEAKVDIEKTSKAGSLIANMTQLIGAPIGATTIETHLKKINQALVSRTK